MKIDVETQNGGVWKCISRFLPLLLLISFSPLPHATAQFQLNGSTVMAEEGCLGFQPANNFISGTFWETQKIDLRDTFDMNFRLFLGCAGNTSDDGLVFAFQSVGASLGSYGGNMGFDGLSPTLGVEVDLRQDAGDGDPAADHLAIIRNGDLGHAGPNNLAGPVPAATGSDVIQDCDWHELRIVWRPGDQTLMVYFDCEQRLTYTGNLINELFGGDSRVLWGFTSGARGDSSAVLICPDLFQPLGLMEDVSLCAGSSVRLEAPVQGRSYVWRPREGLSSPFSASPIASPSQTTTYEVIIKQDCGRQHYDEVTVTVTDLQQEFDLGPADTIACRGAPLVLDATVENASYQWSTGSEAPRIQVDRHGRYAVTVTTPACTATDEINVRFNAGPGFSFEGDTILCQGEELLIEITGEPNLVRWEDGSSDIARRIARPGNYRVQAGNDCGTGEASINLDIQTCREFYIPNAFSPNGDGINDRFVLFGNPDHNTRILSLRIFDRWGNLVFEVSNSTPGDASTAWDGTFRGREAPAGTYLFYVEWELPSGKKRMEAGTAQLLR